MSQAKATLVDETPTHYVMHDGKSPFRVPKAGLSEALHAKIRATAGAGYANGGSVKPHLKGKILSETTTQDPTPEKPHIQGRIISETTTYPEPEKPAIHGKILSERTYPEEQAPKGPPATEEEARELSVQRWRGGEIPARGYADGGAVGGIDPSVEQMIRDPGPQVQTIDFGMRQLPPGGAPVGGIAPSVERMPVSPPGPVDFGMQQIPPQGLSVWDIPNPMTGLPPPKPDLDAQEKAAQAELERRWLEHAAKPGAIKVLNPKEAPAAPAKPAGGIPGGGAALPRAPQPSSAMGEASEAEKRAIGAQADVTAARADQEAAVLRAQGQAMLDLQQRQQEIQNRARVATDAAMGKVRAAQDEISRIDTTVDPGRFWASRTTGGKIAGIIGLVLGAVGAGNDGVNRAAGLLNQAIDRDLDAQKAEHELRMRKGQQALQGAQSLYAMTRDATGDELAAHAAAKAAALELTKNKLDTIIASTANPQARAQAQMLRAQVDKQKAQADAQAGQVVFDNNMKVEGARQGRQHLALQAQEIGAKIAGAGGGLSNEEKSKIYDVESMTRNIRRNISKAKDLIKAYGTFEAFGTGGPELKRALGEVAQDYARLVDPGSTVKEGELKVAKEKLGVEGGELLTSNETAMRLLDSFEKGIDERHDTALRVRGIRP